MSNMVIAPSAGPAGAGLDEVLAFVASDVVHATNSTTLSDVTGLTFDTTASATEYWEVIYNLIVNMNASGTATADFKFGFNVSGGQTISWNGGAGLGENTAANAIAGTQATTVSFGSATGISLIRLVALVKANNSAGAVQLEFAQNVGATNAVVTIKADSFMRARRVRT